MLAKQSRQEKHGSSYDVWKSACAVHVQPTRLKRLAHPNVWGSCFSALRPASTTVPHKTLSHIQLCDTTLSHAISFTRNMQHTHTQLLTHHVLYRSVFHRVLSFFLIFPAHFHACFVLIFHGCLAFDCVSCPACTNRTG